jgi:hypothetical protein
MDVLISELQKKFDRLKVLYEQFFMGIERIEPLTLRKEITRAIMGLQGVHLRNSTLRFKVATLIQKWNIYQSYWNRTLRDIELGRYERHVVTARKRAEREGVEFPAEAMGLSGFHAQKHAEVSHVETPEQGDPAQQARPIPPAHPAPSPRPPPIPQGIKTLVPGMSDKDVRELYQKVITAQRAAGEQNETRFETLVAQLTRQVPKLMEEHGAKVSFEVVNKDGKVRLKPLLKK